MKVLVFGASGKTGRIVVERARVAGHTVTAFTRSGTAFGDGMRIVEGDVGNMQAVQTAVADQDAVIDVIGGKTPYKSTDLETVAARNILAGMSGGSAKRLIVVSALGAGDSGRKAPAWVRYLLVPTFLRGSTKDKTAMEAIVRAGNVPYVIVRPAILTDKPATGVIKIIASGGKAGTITRADAAQFLVDQLQTDANLGKAVVISNG